MLNILYLTSLFFAAMYAEAAELTVQEDYDQFLKEKNVNVIPGSATVAFNPLNSFVTHVCIFDMDRTLTTTQLGNCPGGIPKIGVIDPAYTNRTDLILIQAEYAEEALRGCHERGYGVAIATKCPGCSEGHFDQQVSKLNWIHKLLYKSTGYELTPESWAELYSKVSPFQCGDVPKILMLKQIQRFYKVPYSNMVFFDDQVTNEETLGKDADTAQIHIQLVSNTRVPGENCIRYTDYCCGVTKEDFQKGMEKLEASLEDDLFEFAENIDLSDDIKGTAPENEEEEKSE